VAPAVTVPGAPGPSATSKNPHLHNFVTAVIGALAGPGPTTYTTDANGKVVAAPYAPESTGTKLKRIAANAFEGLSAGAQVGPQKSGLAAALAGFGAGANAVGNKMTAEDQAAQKKARTDWEAEQQMTLRKMEIAKANAQNIGLYYENVRRQNDLDPVRAQNKEIADAFKSIPGHSVTEMDAEAAKKAVADPNNQIWAHTHLILPAGMQPFTDDNGNPVKDEEGNFKSKGRVFVVDGTKDGKIPLPDSIVSDVQKFKGYGDLAAIGSSLEHLEPGQEMDPPAFVKLYNGLLSAKVAVAKGWTTPDLSEDKDGNVIQHNSVSGEIKPANEQQTQKFRMDQANLAEKQQQARTSKATENKENVETQLKRKQLTDENSLNPPASAGLTGDAYLKTLPQGQQDVLKAVAEGRETRSPRQLQDKNGNPTPFAEALHRAYPDFDDKKAIAYGAVVKDFTSGPTSRSLTSYGTAINHARALYDNTNMKSYIPGTDEYKRYNQDITYVATEVAKALNPTGVATESAIKEQEEALRSYTNRKAAIENAEHILTGKMAETKQRWLNAQVRPSYQPPMPGLSKEAITNADYIRNHGQTPQNGQPSAAQKQNPFRNSQPGQ
jgi:hypothetical protein